MPTYRTSGGKYIYSSYPPVEATTVDVVDDIGKLVFIVVLVVAFSAFMLTIGFFISTVENSQEEQEDVRSYV